VIVLPPQAFEKREALRAFSVLSLKYFSFTAFSRELISML